MSPCILLQQFTRQASEGVWQHDMFEKVTEILPPFAVRPLGIETGTKLYISNLDYAVSTDDIKVSSLSVRPPLLPGNS